MGAQIYLFNLDLKSKDSVSTFKAFIVGNQRSGWLDLNAY